MKEYVSIDIQSNKDVATVIGLCNQLLPDYSWKSGDSDAQGPYLSGKNKDSVKIKIWLGEAPYEMSISFQNSWLQSQDKEDKMKNVVSNITNNVIPNFGQVTSIDT